MPETPPTYDELVAVLRAAPPRRMVLDQRFWDWRGRLEALLARLDAAPPPSARP